MNDRLRELMLEAGYAAPELAGRATKLVDLIVRECANAVRDGTWEGDNFAARVEGVFGINHPTITFRDEE